MYISTYFLFIYAGHGNDTQMCSKIQSHFIFIICIIVWCMKSRSRSMKQIPLKFIPRVYLDLIKCQF